jgi:arylsulfatase A-like enzyme
MSPCIDYYAQRAVRFDSAYIGSFPTLPMRNDSFTGAINWPHYGWEKPKADQPKFSEILKEAGYFTGLVVDTEHMIGAGFPDHFNECHFIKKEVDDGIKPEDIVVPVPREHYRSNSWGFLSDRMATSHYRHEEDWFVARTMMRACQWLEDNSARDKWFLWVDTFEIHEDWRAPQYYTDLYAKGYTGPDYTYPSYGYTDIYTPEALQHIRDCYAAEVTLTDRWVGHLLRQIELMGLFENTCVILLSDHGMYIGERNRCGKHTLIDSDPWPMYEEISALPLLIWTPSENAPKISNALCQPADIFPTVLDLAEVSSPPTDGKSWKSVLNGESDTCHETIYSTRFHEIVEPTDRENYPPVSIATPTHTAILYTGSKEAELYDRKTDPNQTRNIAKANPEVIKKLRTELIAFLKAHNAGEDYAQAYL